MNFLVIFYIAFLLSTLMVPLSIRLGRSWGIVDKPDPRKIHTSLIPRTGGLAIALGTLTALFAVLPSSRPLSGYLGGGAVILAFGIWDDMRDLNYKLKFLGQILAVLLFILLSDIKISCLGELWPGSTVFLGPASILVTVIFVLAVINIINLSDGLDALAGGLSLLVLLACALLGYVQETLLPIAVALAVSGGLVGFMRFNMHPAEVFMGDTGSQFLGYSIGVCLMMLTQGESIYSPVLPLFLLGTPVLDTAMVIYERIQSGNSPFKPDKNHLHHKLLRAGLSQEQAVISIYFLHFSLILIGFGIRFVQDYIALTVYILIFCAIMFLRRAIHGKNIDAHNLYSSIKNGIVSLFIWNGKPLDIRYCISCIFWKSFFALFFLFFFINIIYIDSYPPYILHTILTLSIFLLILFFIDHKCISIKYIYYILLFFILYTSVYGSIGSIEKSISMESYNLLSITFFALTFFYFGCLILTPEKIPLNPLDYILLAFVFLLILIPEGQSDPYNVRQIIMKAVLLGLALNLIFSRIDRNRKYIIFVTCFLLGETAFMVLFRRALL